MTNETDDPIRDLDLYWLRAELAALPRSVSPNDPVADLRIAARKALLRAQSSDPDAPDHAMLERLVALLVVDRIFRTAGRRLCTMDRERFRDELLSPAGQPAPFGLRFDVAYPGASLNGHKGPMQ